VAVVSSFPGNLVAVDFVGELAAAGVAQATRAHRDLPGIGQRFELVNVVWWLMGSSR
jgi:hypothetical protein